MTTSIPLRNNKPAMYYTTNFRNVKIFCNWTGTCGKPERIRVQ